MEEKLLTRRSFTKIAAATGVALAAAGSIGLREATADEAVGATETGGEVQRIRTACRGCGKMECGVWVTVQNGRAIMVEGDMSSFQSFGNCCSKSQASIQAAYHPDRLHYPLKRTNPKGDDDPGWVRISWDEAFESSAAALKQIAEKYGGESLFAMAGTSRIYCMSTYSQSLNGLVGSPNTMVSFQVCKGPRHFATQMVSQFAHSWMATVDRPKVYVQWGGASEISNYDDSCRSTVDAAVCADVFISVDPRKSNLGKEADHWMHVRPGTDAALALSWGHVIIENDLIDDLYVRKWTNGPFLVCEDIEPSGFLIPGRSPWELKTKLLKESDIVEGGSPTRFMVWDELAGSDAEHPLHANDPTGHLTWFDADGTKGTWEGEDWKAPAAVQARQEHLMPGVEQGKVYDCSPFDPDILPALYGEFEITLKDGRKASVTPVWQLYANRCAEYKPEIAEGICNIPAAKIEAAAKAYATRLDPTTGYGNGGIQYMLAVEHYANAIQNCRAIDALTGITGNFDTPAGNRGPTAGPIGNIPLSIAYGAPMSTADPTKQIGRERFPLLNWWGGWGDCTSIWDAVETGEPYPVKMAICQSGDHMNMANSLHAWEQLKKLEFQLTLDLWAAPTAGMSDILLPVAHWMETECCRISQGSHGAYGAIIQCIDRPFECKEDGQIVCGLYKAMGVPWAPGPDPWPDNLDINRTIDIDGMHDEDGNPMDWQAYRTAFIKNGWWDAKKFAPEDWGAYRRYESGYLRTTNYGWSGSAQYGYGADYVPVPGLSTPTMKQEIWSTVVETFHPGEGYELPTFTEPPESPVAAPELHEKYPFTVITGRRMPIYFHNEHRQLPWCRELWPTPRIEMNPADAEKLGVKQGDWVWIENDRAKIRQTVDLYYGIPEGVVNCEHQWWFPELSQASKGFELSGANCLVDRHAQDPFCAATNLRGYAAKVYKAEEGVPKGNDGTPIIQSASDPRLKEWLPLTPEQMKEV
ncbi:MAG: molybdopterin-dependent oxidoreductase [Coriobacteriales bacterium]|jgi:anaerobic selenocysteine-containing dehydrogenase|nr:molybdopterin-dependent oxidoreductase [Coriobacteriales bacterium]